MSPRVDPWWRGLGPGDEMAPAELEDYGDEDGEDGDSGERAIPVSEARVYYVATCETCGGEVCAFALSETAGFCLGCDDFRGITGVHAVTRLAGTL